MVALAAMPSASVALVITRSATLGVTNDLAVAAGIVLGDLVFVVLAFLGLSVMAETLGSLFVMVRILGGLYLLWFGFSLLKSDGRPTTALENPPGKRNLLAGFLAGLVLTLGDIKAIVFYASLFPAFVDPASLGTSEITFIVAITIVGVGGVKSIYALFAKKVATTAQGLGMESAARKAAGGLMLGTGGYLIVKG